MVKNFLILLIFEFNKHPKYAHLSTY